GVRQQVLEDLLEPLLIRDDAFRYISDILDLSKIESGKVSVDAEEISVSNLIEVMARPFRHEAENRNLSFAVEVGADITK
ncbi:hypothetical protein ACC760_39600, partial [Rhizobium ruizarguesonis]